MYILFLYFTLGSKQLENDMKKLLPDWAELRGLILIFLAWIFLVMPVYADELDDYPQIMWWYDLNAPSFGSAAVGDIDGDNYPEIVFGTYFGDERIIALNAESGDTLWTYNTGGCNDASPVIVDVDLDGELEVIVPASSPCMVYCFNGETGEIEWSTSTGSNYIDSPPAIADVDNDNKPEVVFGAFYGYVYCLDGEDGGINWSTNLGTNSYIQSGPNIFDIDDNGQLDIIVAQWMGDCRVYALKGDDHEILWHSDIPQDWMYHGGAFADVDEDGLPEISIGCYDNHVYLLNAEDGSLEWDYEASSYCGAPTSIADLNNDGHLEIVFVSNYKLITLSHTGDSLWSYTTGGSIFRGAAIADIDGDDTLDVVFGSDDGILRALQGSNGALVWTYNLEQHYGNTFEMDHAPVIADFDNDGKLDVFIIGGYGTSSTPENNHARAYVLSAGDGTGPGWPMFRHDIRHSANFENQGMLCGDADGEGHVNISDAVYIINYVFAGGSAPDPLEAGDVNCDEAVNVSDAVYIINYIFVSGNRPCDPDGDFIPDC